MEFKQFDIHPLIMKGIDAQGFKEPTPVQEKVIPEALKGKDVRVCAQTGTGKTIAFVIPTLHKRLNSTPSKGGGPRILVLVPTRELGAQVFKVFEEVGRDTKINGVLILGGLNINTQIRKLKSHPKFIVATPGRLLDLIRRRNVSLKQVDTLVFDEADRMLDMGFLPDIRTITNHCPQKRQTMLFSATYPLQIQQMVAKFLKDPISIDLAPSTPANTVTQMVYPVSRLQKEALLLALLENANLSSGIIFCRTKHGADQLVSSLKKVGKSVIAIHSNKSQRERIEAINGFQQKKYQILVATDIASRGLDIKDVSHVINYDVPHHPEDYVHRIGRTGRAQATGDAFTLVTHDDEPFMTRIEKFIQKSVPRGAIPDFPYLVPPKLITKPKSAFDAFGSRRRRIPSSRARRFRR